MRHQVFWIGLLLGLVVAFPAPARPGEPDHLERGITIPAPPPSPHGITALLASKPPDTTKPPPKPSPPPKPLPGPGVPGPPGPRQQMIEKKTRPYEPPPPPKGEQPPAD